MSGKLHNWLGSLLQVMLLHYFNLGNASCRLGVCEMVHLVIVTGLQVVDAVPAWTPTTFPIVCPT